MMRTRFQVEFKLRIQKITETTSCDYLGVGVVQTAAEVAHVLAIDALGASGHANHRNVVHRGAGCHHNTSKYLSSRMRRLAHHQRRKFLKHQTEKLILCKGFNFLVQMTNFAM
jgi:hypothetical protein